MPLKCIHLWYLVKTAALAFRAKSGSLPISCHTHLYLSFMAAFVLQDKVGNCNRDHTWPTKSKIIICPFKKKCIEPCFSSSPTLFPLNILAKVCQDDVHRYSLQGCLK